MKNVLLLYIATSISIAAVSQSTLINWKQNYGGDEADGGDCVIELSDGNILAGGYAFSTNGDVHDHFGADWYADGWLIKTNQQGDTLWTRSFGGSYNDFIADIYETSDGSILVAFTTESNNGSFENNPNGNSSTDFGIMKLTANGDSIWSKSFGGSYTDKPRGIFETSGGNYIIGGYSYSSSSQVSSPPNGDVSAPLGSDDFWLIKLDLNGNLIWDKSIGGTDGDVMAALQPTLDGNMIAIGFSWSSSGDVPGNNGFIDYLAVKIDTSGNVLWGQNYGGSSYDYGYDIFATSDSGYVATGSAYSSDGDVSNHYGNYDIWVTKMDKNGALEWNKSYGGTAYDGAYSIIENSAKGYVFAGATESTDNDVSTSYDLDDAWIVHIDSLGAIVWEETIGGDSIDQASSIIQKQDGSYVMTGLTQSNEIDIDGTIHGGYGTEDFWLLGLKCQPSYAPEICMVTVDTSSTKNVVVWEKPAIIGIETFNVYREITGTYSYVGSVPYDSLSIYTDNTAGINPSITSYRYKISSVDTCGYESELGGYHETIHLTTSLGTGNDINLVWDDYEGFTINKYYILRDSTGTGNFYQVLDSVGGSNFTYTDQNPPNVSNINYVIEVVPPGVCVATKAANYSSSRSNRATQAPASAAPPQAGFTQSTTTVMQGQSITYTDQTSLNPTSWSWTFEGGTPNSSTFQNPVITYNTPGTFYVKLVAYNGFGADSVQYNSYITVTSAGPKPNANLTSSATIIAVGDSIDYFDLSTNTPTSWYWIFSNGNPVISTDQNPTDIKYNTVGSFDVTLISTNANGSDTIFIQDYITVTTPSGGLAPVATLSASATTIYEGDSIDFSDLSTNSPNSWQWIFTGGTPSSSTNQNPQDIQYNTAGTYDLTLIATNSNGSDMLTIPDYITVLPITTLSGDINGNGIIDSGETAGDTDGNGIIGVGETAGDLNGNGIIDDGEIAGDINGNGIIDNDEVAGDVTGDGEIGPGELTGDLNGNGIINVDEVFGDSNGNGILDNGETNNIEEVDYASTINLYPNPTNGYFVLELYNKSSNLVHVKIYNSIGQEVLSEAYNVNGELKKEFNFTNLSSGVYNVEININGQSTSKRLVVK